MENYKPNSHKFNSEQKEIDERKKLDKVVTGEAKRIKKNEMARFKDVFISEDAKNVKSYILSDVLIPAVKKLINDIVTDGIQMILFGGTSRKSGVSGSRVNYVSYNNYSNSRNENSVVRRPATGYSFDKIRIDNRGEAEEVLSQMDAIIEKYGMARVTDFYDLVGVTGNYTDNKYGWSNLSTARIVRTSDGGYVIELPRAMPIE